LVAKIERAEAVESDEVLDDIIMASDAVMVARGDLGVEIGDAALIGVQKHIIDRARTLNRGVITATQMMESMISSSLPTRAEVFDVANAVLDGTDAVMLSAETAAGQFPVETVEAMVRIIVGAEKHPQSNKPLTRAMPKHMAIDQAIAQAAMHTANNMPGVKAIVCLTETGSTPLLMSRYGTHLPVFAFSRHENSLRRAALYRGVETIRFDSDTVNYVDANEWAVGQLIDRGVVQEGDLVIISKGDVANVVGGTNTLKIVEVGKPIAKG
jgi:pyruvate kinase